MFPINNMHLDIESDRTLLSEIKQHETEIKITEMLTKYIADTNVSKHIVRYIGSNKCINAHELFRNCPDTFVDFIE